MEKVLIIDDVKINRQVLKGIIEKEGYKIKQANSGNAGLKLMKKEPPDLILLDVLMPDEDGFEICRKIRANKKFELIPIIFITALEDVNDKVKGFAAGANDYITKPFESVEVLARIKAGLRIKKIEEELLKNEKQLAISAVIVTLNHKINNALFGLPFWKDFVKKKKEDKAPKEDIEILDTMLKQIDYIVNLVRKIKELSADQNLDKIKYDKYIGTDIMMDI